MLLEKLPYNNSQIVTLLYFFRDALKDVDRILVDLNDPKNSRALAVRGDALYNLGNFEHALLNYHRAKKRAKLKVCSS